MKRFYGVHNLGYIVLNILINFPLWIFPAAFSLFSMRVRYLVFVFKEWHRLLFRNQTIRFGGYFIVKNWYKRFKQGNYLKVLKAAKKQMMLKKQKQVIS